MVCRQAGWKCFGCLEEVWNLVIQSQNPVPQTTNPNNWVSFHSFIDAAKSQYFVFCFRKQCWGNFREASGVEHITIMAFSKCIDTILNWTVLSILYDSITIYKFTYSTNYLCFSPKQNQIFHLMDWKGSSIQKEHNLIQFFCFLLILYFYLCTYPQFCFCCCCFSVFLFFSSSGVSVWQDI